MQKKLIALAIAGLSSAAFAQSNVTIYGVADVSFEATSAGGGTTGNATVGTGTYSTLAGRNRIATNGSYFGLKGAEDLGGGMKALYQIENEFDFGQGTNNGVTANASATATGNPVGQSRPNGLANRDSFVGITGNFGTVVAGWLSSPHRAMAAKFDLMPGAGGAGSSLNIIGRINTGSVLNPRNPTTGVTAHTFGNTTTTPSTTYAVSHNPAGVAAATASIVVPGTAETITNNAGVIGRHAAIAYASPVFNGFQGTIAYVANETKDNYNLGGTSTANGTYASRNPNAWNVRLDYDNGPLSVGYSYLDIKDFGVLGGATATAASTVGNTGGTVVSATTGGALVHLNLSGAEKHTSQILAAKYTFNQATTVSFMYDQTKSTLFAGPQTIGTVYNGTAIAANSANAPSDIQVKRNSYYLGLKHSMGMHDFTAAYAKAGKNSVDVGLRANAATRDYEGGSDASMWSLRYAYNFSKRTAAYAQYAQISNGSNASYDFGTGGTNVMQTGNGSIRAGANPTVWSFGVRHNF